MNIQLFDKSNEKYVKEAANLLAVCFPQAYSDCAFKEMNDILDEDRITVMAVENNHLIGFVWSHSAVWSYGVGVHPLV